MSRHAKHRKESSPSVVSRRAVLTGTAALALTATGILEVVSDGDSNMGNQADLVLTHTPDPGDPSFDELLPPKPTRSPAPPDPGVSSRSARPARAARKAKPKPVSNRRAILRTARSLFGVPYLWGGNTPATGLDCSGYTRWVYARHGLRLPRTSAAQHAYCTPVSHPLPGDLVFFHYPSGKVHHVGIFASAGRMFDAPHRGSTVGDHGIYPGHSFGRHPRL